MSIILDHVCYQYKDNVNTQEYAIKDINLKIEDGEFIGLIGHTGSGKSTLIQHFNGLVKASAGNIYYNGQNIYEKDFSMKALRGKVGLVFQYPEHQLFESTVIKDISFGPKNLGLPALEADLRSYQAMKDVGLSEELLDVSPFALSGGQKRRVAIAGVLVTKPEVLILDEPVAGLDPVGKKQLMSILHEIHRTTLKTIIIVSHDMDEVCENCNKIAVFAKGKVVECNSPELLFSSTKKLEDLRLDLPITAKITEKLKEIGVDIQTDYKINDFIYAVKQEYSKISLGKENYKK